jgi:hypothetical protein
MVAMPQGREGRSLANSVWWPAAFGTSVQCSSLCPYSLTPTRCLLAPRPPTHPHTRVQAKGMEAGAAEPMSEDEYETEGAAAAGGSGEVRVEGRQRGGKRGRGEFGGF